MKALLHDWINAVVMGVGPDKKDEFSLISSLLLMDSDSHHGMTQHRSPFQMLLDFSASGTE
jgi:hypothetical protein